MSNSLASLTSVEWTQGKLDEKQTLADFYEDFPGASSSTPGVFSGTLEGGKKYWYDWDGTPDIVSFAGLTLAKDAISSGDRSTVEMHIHYCGTTDLTLDATHTISFPTDWIWIESSDYTKPDLPSTMKAISGTTLGDKDGHYICFVARVDKNGNIIVNKAYDYGYTGVFPPAAE